MTFDELADYGEFEKICKEVDSMTEKELLESIGMTEEEYEQYKNRVLNMIEGYKFLYQVERLVKTKGEDT